MSLYKQLWLGVIFLLTLVFSVSVLVTTLSARAYLEQQLSMKNADNATALALSLTEQGADKVLLELTLAAQFDTGYYELIELIDPEGRVAARRTADEVQTGAPDWFMSLFPIRVEPGVAPIQAGWQQAGVLTLRSHSRFAYEELWQNTYMLTGIFLLAGLGAGLLGSVSAIDKVGFAKQESEIAGFHAARGDHDAAEKAYKRALDEAGPTDLHLVYFNQGVFYSDLGRLADAAQSLESSVAANPEFRQARVKLGKVHRRIQACPDSLMALDLCP
jgi:tetratricopeptide (TPR) repeat protein